MICDSVVSVLSVGLMGVLCVYGECFIIVWVSMVFSGGRL